MGLGERIKLARGQLTQKELAEKLGVDNTTIASWETGRREPDIDSLIKIADWAGVSLDWLASRKRGTIEEARICNNDKWNELIQLSVRHKLKPEHVKAIIETLIAIQHSK